jgi:type VI secretion system Hcp family effector
MAFHHYASFKGKTQGQLKGESLKAQRRDKWTELVSFGMASEVPLGPKSIRPRGPRTPFPLTITKETGASSPQLLNAHWTNELFETVVIEVVGRPDSGQSETVKERITLTNAQIVHYRCYGGSGVAGTYKPLEDYGFIFASMRRLRFP